MPDRPTSRPARFLKSATAAVVMTAAATLVITAPLSVAQPGKKVDYIRHVAPDNPNPAIAEGVTLTAQAKEYKSSGLGPAALNTAAAAGTPGRYVDPQQFPGGTLTGGVTITEAQAMNVLRQIERNLGQRGLRLSDVTSMRVFLDNAPGTDRADYDGWNRAYRQFFANTDLQTGKVVAVPMGTQAPARPLVVNSARPSRFTIEVASLPVQGWLVEVEVDAVYPRGR